MQSYWQRQFEKLETASCNPAIHNQILSRIESRQISRRTVRKVIALTALSTSVALGIPLLAITNQLAHTAGLFEILTLVNSDLAFVTSHLSQYGLAVLEALPSMEISAVLALLLISSLSVRELFNRAPSRFSPLAFN